MAEFEEDIPYFMPTVIDAATTSSNTDEDDYSSLLAVKKELETAISEIDHISVFDLKEGELTIKEQIAAYSKARDILIPLYERVRTAISDVRLRQMEGKNGR